MVMTRILLLFTSICLSGCATPNLTATITEYGLYSAQKSAKINSPNTAFGSTSMVSNIELLQTSTEVPLQLGQRFGYWYILDCANKSADYGIEQVIYHPPIKGKTVSSAALFKKCGTKYYTGYSFGSNDELVEGDFTIQLRQNGNVLVEKIFTTAKVD